MKDVFTNIYKKNLWGGAESISGPGSSLVETRQLIRRLPFLIKHFQIKKIIDAPCGDFNWMKELYMNFDSYIGIDIVEDIIKNNKRKYFAKNVHFYNYDITKDPLPTADLILCRDCLVHFSFEDAQLAINNFKSSGSKYLLTTTFFNHKRNTNINTGNWYPINLEIEPFNFPKPILYISENSRENGKEYMDKSLGLWELEKL
jgi:hypothetical protein